MDMRTWLCQFEHLDPGHPFLTHSNITVYSIVERLSSERGVIRVIRARYVCIAPSCAPWSLSMVFLVTACDSFGHAALTVSVFSSWPPIN